MSDANAIVRRLKCFVCKDDESYEDVCDSLGLICRSCATHLKHNRINLESVGAGIIDIMKVCEHDMFIDFLSKMMKEIKKNYKCKDIGEIE